MRGLSACASLGRVAVAASAVLGWCVAGVGAAGAAAAAAAGVGDAAAQPHLA